MLLNSTVLSISYDVQSGFHSFLSRYHIHVVHHPHRIILLTFVEPGHMTKSIIASQSNFAPAICIFAAFKHETIPIAR